MIWGHSESKVGTCGRTEPPLHGAATLCSVLSCVDNQEDNPTRHRLSTPPNRTLPLGSRGVRGFLVQIP